MKKRKYINSNLVGTLGLGGFAALAFLLLTPTSTMIDHASATSTDSTTTAVNALVKPSISLSAPSSLNLELMPDVESEFASVSGTVTVSTNNASGYRLLINSANTNTLVSHDKSSSNPNDVISSIDSSSTPNNFVDNTWGYYLGTAQPSDTTIYQPLSTTATEALKTDTSSTDTDSTSYYNLAFGTKVSNTLPAGTYSNSVVISAVANPLEIHSLSDLTFMQDMTTSICAETPSAYNSATGITDKTSTYYANPVTKQLIDLRDGKKYWVAKLADGECWMTQNLALNLGTAPDSETEARLGRFVPKLTPADSDVSEEWVPSVSTSSSLTPLTTEISNQSSSSWNLGNYLHVTPGTSDSCLTEEGGQYVPSIAECKKIGMLNIDNGWKMGFSAQNGDYSYDSVTNAITAVPNAGGATFITANTDERTYDSHYLIGSYYQTNVIMAGTVSGTAQPFMATNSICPKGWSLPHDNKEQATIDNPGTDTYINLASRYGTLFVNTNNNNLVTSEDFSPYKVFYTPLSGTINATSGGIVNVGIAMGLRTSSVASGLASYVHVSKSSMILASNGLPSGMSVRCLAR